MTIPAALGRAFDTARGFLRRPPAMGEAQRFLLLSILIGVFAGLMVVCFHDRLHVEREIGGNSTKRP